MFFLAIFLSIYVSLFVCLFVRLLFFLCAFYLYFCLSVCLSQWHSVSFVCLCIEELFYSLFVFCVYLSKCLFFCLSVCFLSVCLFAVYLCTPWLFQTFNRSVKLMQVSSVNVTPPTTTNDKMDDLLGIQSFAKCWNTR